MSGTVGEIHGRLEGCPGVAPRNGAENAVSTPSWVLPEPGCSVTEPWRREPGGRTIYCTAWEFIRTERDRGENGRSRRTIVTTCMRMFKPCWEVEILRNAYRICCCVSRAGQARRSAASIPFMEMPSSRCHQRGEELPTRRLWTRRTADQARPGLQNEITSSPRYL